MDLAIIGSGISGMLSAALLHRDHRITVYEACERIGGHTHTVDVTRHGQVWPVDTGFIVYNDWTYPNFIRMLELLGVAGRASDMSFSVQCEASGLEYNGSSLDQIFAQRANLLRPGFHRMLRDILRFNKEATELLAADETRDDPEETLGDYLRRRGYGDAFAEHYLIPMGASIWSANPATFAQFPAASFVRFFHNHGMLLTDGRPTWRTVVGGSRVYAAALTARYRHRIRLQTPVAAIRRDHRGVTVITRDGRDARHDGVVLACHSDQALALLADPSRAETEILSALPYQQNEAILHTDQRLLPRRRKCWAAWNYHIPATPQPQVAITYDMNILQGFDAPSEFLVSLNLQDRIDPAAVIHRQTYHHPRFTPEGIRAQRRRREISGVRNTWYCGAYWRFGFHEDGVLSALAVCRDFGLNLEDLATELTPSRTLPASCVATALSPAHPADA